MVQRSLLMMRMTFSIGRGLGTMTSSAAIEMPYSMHTVMPYTWKKGMAAITFSPPSTPLVSHARTCRVLHTRLRWVSMAAFGTPVVPPVYWNSATSSGRAAGAGAGSVVASR